MKFIKTFLVIVGCLCLGTLASCTQSKSTEQATTSAQSGNDQTAQAAAAPTNSGEGAERPVGGIAVAGQGADELHTPPQGSSERQALMDALREAYKGSRNGDGQPNRGRITFVVKYLKVHSGWAWVYAEPQSSDANDQFGENSGFLLHEDEGQWKVMKLPPMIDDPDDPENLDYPGRKDVERIRKMYPSVPADIFPKAH